MKTTKLAALPAVALVLLALSGCGKSGVEAENESAQSVARKVQENGDLKLQPGRWETSVTLGKVDMPGAPAGAADAVRAQQQRGPTTMATCLTQADVDRMDGSMFDQGAEGCKYDSFKMGGGKIDGVMSCTQGAQKIAMTMNGTYTPETYDIAMSTSTEMAPGKAMTMDMKVASRRTGACDGSEMGAKK